MAAFSGSAATERVETKLRFTLFEEGLQLCQHPLQVQAHFFTDLPAGKLLLVKRYDRALAAGRTVTWSVDGFSQWAGCQVRRTRWPGTRVRTSPVIPSSVR